MRGTFMKANARFFLSGGAFVRGGHRPVYPQTVPDDFFGLCVATQEDPAADDYILRCLRECGVRQVRLDLVCGEESAFAVRLLKRLLREDYRVWLHLVQPLREARSMKTSAAQRRWREGMVRLLEICGRRLDTVEVGTTLNRRRWSGYDADGFLAAWAIAREETSRRELRLAGPNVTDFEPVYNVALLDALRRAGQLPDVHTDNLFAERATEPEAYDPRILGRLPAALIKYNLIKKARLLRRIASRYGVARNVCTHVSWSARRIARFLADVEEKQADYLVRYLCLAAVSGGLDCVYWGPLVGQREGLVDDGTVDYPVLPHVALYGETRGDVACWRKRPALRALAFVRRTIGGAVYERAWASGRGLEVHAFAKGGERVHVLWTRDGRGMALRPLYEEALLASAVCHDRDGRRLPEPPEVVLERPVYLVWPDSIRVAVRGTALPEGHLRFHGSGSWSYRPIREGDWRGWRRLPDAARPDRAAALWLPEILSPREARVMLRSARNQVWKAPHAWMPGKEMVVKRCRVMALHKKWLQRGRPGKAARSWSGAWELVRRGCETPLPIAYFESARRPGLRDSYYLCETAAADGSVREAFTAFASGADSYRGLPAAFFYRRLAGCLFAMHDRGVYYRDLSAGNVLVRIGDGEAHFVFIDTARARFFSRPLALSRRLADLKRLVHPLHGEGRRTFVGLYLALMNRAFTWPRSVPFACYDLKHAIKNRLKRIRAQLSGSPP